MVPQGAQVIAQSLYDLGVRVLFGLVGVPVTEIAESFLALPGCRFIALRNEQSASYAGVCLVVAGPGVLHAMAGVGNASANAWPLLLLLAGSNATSLVGKGNFQEMDAISLLTPHVKLAARPVTIFAVDDAVRNSFRTAWYGRPGPTFVDLPADVIHGRVEESEVSSTRGTLISRPPKSYAAPLQIKKISALLKNAKAPLVIIGKGAAYAQAESVIRTLVNNTHLPFLPTPMGKGVVPDSHASNVSSARSVALRGADMVLVLGARLNWILHYGEAPKWSEKVRIIQIDIDAAELGKNGGDQELAVLGDVEAVTGQIVEELGSWRFDRGNSIYGNALGKSIQKNEEKLARLAKIDTVPLTYHRTFDVLKETLHRLSPPDHGNIVYVSEGSNTMDISRSIFPLHHPRRRLDAGTYATMGVGLSYAIAAWCAYNLSNSPTYSSSSPTSESIQRKKIVCLEGDSAFGFSMAEIETMARYGMDILVYVINNSGIYNGDTTNREVWKELRERTNRGGVRMRSWSLGFEVGYEMVAEMCGGRGFLVRTAEELAKATEEGFKSSGVVIINVIIEPGRAGELVEFPWQQKSQKQDAKL